MHYRVLGFLFKLGRVVSLLLPLSMREFNIRPYFSMTFIQSNSPSMMCMLIKIGFSTSCVFSSMDISFLFSSLKLKFVGNDVVII